MNRFLFAVAALGLVACGTTSVLPSVPEPQPMLEPVAEPSEPKTIARELQLRTFATCTSLEATVKAKLSAIMRAAMAQNLQTALQYYRHGYYGWGADGGFAGAGGGSGTGGGSSSAGGTGGGAAGPMDVTGTNVQVQGVDEPDIIKNDGNRIFMLSKGKLFATRSWPAADLALQGSLVIPGAATEMFLDGEQVVVFSNQWAQGDQKTLATIIDVSNLASMKVVGQYEVPGTYRSARRIGTSVRMVTNRYFAWPRGVQTWFSYWGRSWKNEQEIHDEHNRLVASNEALILTAKLPQLLPPAFWRATQTAEFNVDCSAVHLNTGSTALGYSEVATFQTDVPARLNRQVLFETADELYADDDSLYFTSRHWWWGGWQPGSVNATYIHKFDTKSPGAAQYVASGAIDGHLVDQFSMDEWQGNLRVASTVWGPTGTWNEVVVLAPAAARLVEIGKSAKLALGERITSARFMGGVGYVVTFRQTDPLFVFDLNDPKNPKKVGELKVPGFSSYIHPLGANHLLTIGTYQPEFGGWAERAVQLAIFDVTDLTNPKQTHLQLLGNYTASSEAQGNHKAFNFFPAKGLLAVPFYQWSWSTDPGTSYPRWYHVESDLRVFSVDANLGFTSRGTMSMSDLGTRTSYYSWDSVVRRSVMADDFVYAISEAGIRVANVNALSTPVATAKF